MIRINFRAMGCGIEILIDQDDASRIEEVDQIPIWFQKWEKTFSRFDPTSELSILNGSPGIPHHISAEMLEVLQEAVQAAKISGGLVNPLTLPSLEKAGYDHSFETMNNSMSWYGDLSMPAIPNFNQLVLDSEELEVTIPIGSGIDLSGIVKGWAAEKTRERLSKYGGVLVNVGGDIACSQTKKDEKWEIKVLDPIVDSRTAHTIYLQNGAVATSGIDHRFWYQGDTLQHHIIDPRTGLPAETDILTSTIIAKSAVDAEIGAKIVLILGLEDGLTWLDEQPNLEGLAIDKYGKKHMSKGFGRFSR